MQLIWYNPDSDCYQKGTIREYDNLISISPNGDRFDILYEFTDTSEKLIEKVLSSLNMVREAELIST